MGRWKLSFLGFLCAYFLFTIGAVELGRNQPTERISGIFADFVFLASSFAWL